MLWKAAVIGAASIIWAGTSVGQTISPGILEDDPAPGTFEPPDLWENFDAPVISEAGVLLATGDTNAPSTLDDVVYVGETLVGLQGFSDPDFLGAFQTFLEPESKQEINIRDDAVFIATLSGAPTTSNKGLYLYEALTDTVSSVVVESDAAPGISGRFISDVEFAGVFDDGGVGYLATLDDFDTGNDSVIYRNGAVLYREGDPIPGLPPTITWNSDFDEVSWNGAGDVFFEGRNSLLFLDRAGVAQAVRSTGDPVTVRGGGTDFVSLFLQTALAQNGDWAFRGNLQNAPAAESAIILTSTGLQIQEGEPIPELPGAVTGNFNGVDVNSNGQVVYLADIIGAADPTIDEGLFVNNELIVHVGMQVPGQDPGVVFTDIAFEDFSINDAGQIAFQASYTGILSAADGLFIAQLSAACPCEYDGDDAQVDIFDLLAYLDLWFAMDPGAEIDGVGGVDIFDLLAFLDCWFAASAGGPCP